MDAAAIIMDQSLAFDLIDHPILLLKLKSLGLDEYSMRLMESYLHNRQQTVQLESYTSPPIHTGPRSVIQGSAMSCLLFIIYTRDLPHIFNPSPLSVQQEELSSRPKSTIYIEDNFIYITPFVGKTLQQSINWTIERVQDYMDNNKLKLNKDKTC